MITLLKSAADLVLLPVPDFYYLLVAPKAKMFHNKCIKILLIVCSKSQYSCPELWTMMGQVVTLSQRHMTTGSKDLG